MEFLNERSWSLTCVYPPLASPLASCSTQAIPPGTGCPCLAGLTPSPTLFCSPKSGLTFKQTFVLSPHLSTLNSITSLSPCPLRCARLTACDPRLHGHLLLDDMSKRCSLACLPAPVVFHSLLRNSVLCSFSLRSLHAQFFPKALYVWAWGGRL